MASDTLINAYAVYIHIEKYLNGKQLKKQMVNKCDECKTELVKTYVLTKFDIPFVCWVCPKSEMFKEYERLFKNKYHKNIK